MDRLSMCALFPSSCHKFAMRYTFRVVCNSYTKGEIAGTNLHESPPFTYPRLSFHKIVGLVLAIIYSVLAMKYVLSTEVPATKSDVASSFQAPDGSVVLL